MKSQQIQSTPTTLGPLVRLLLMLTAQHDAETADLQIPAAELTDLRPAATCGRLQAPRPEYYVSTGAMTLGPFLTLLLTLHDRGTWIDGDCCAESRVPRGAILAARYVSR
jgi:hypothetical protein